MKRKLDNKNSKTWKKKNIQKIKKETDKIITQKIQHKSFFYEPGH